MAAQSPPLFPGVRQRRRVSLSPDALVQASPLLPNSTLPLLVQPTLAGVSLSNWAQHHKDEITHWLHHHGGILFRGFQVQGADDFGTFVGAIAHPPMSYIYRSTPRTQVQGHIYTSTEYPADRTIPLHSEMAYTRQWPLKIAFYCVQPAETGGETPIADTRQILARIPQAVRSRFQEQGVLYVRNYGSGLDLPWQEVFQTQEKPIVEAYCHQAQMEYQWLSDDHLQTRQVCQAIATHPKTSEDVWFNQAHLFHVETLAPTVRDTLLTSMGTEAIPRNAYFGDGSEIPLETLAHIHQAYADSTVMFPWQAGDVLLLDNLLAAHGRHPFTGARQVLAGMGDPWESQDLGATVLPVVLERASNMSSSSQEG